MRRRGKKAARFALLRRLSSLPAGRRVARGGTCTRLLSPRGGAPHQATGCGQRAGSPGTLIEAGLGFMPGTAAEVLSERFERLRTRLCPEKLSARAWCAVTLEAHRAGPSTTATLMVGRL